MYKILLPLMFVLTQAFAVNEMKIMTKAKRVNDIVQIKILFKDRMINSRQAERRTGNKDNASFISHIIAKVNDTVVYNLETSQYLKQHPLFNFYYPDKAKNDLLQLIVTNNKGTELTANIEIKQTYTGSKELTLSPSSFKKKYSQQQKLKVWDIITTKEAIKELFGSNNKIKDGLEISISSSRLRIKSNLELDTIAIFSDDISHYSRKKSPSLRTLITVPENGIINYSLDVVVIGECCENVPITIVGRDNNGQLYKNVQQVIYECSDCDM